MEYCYVLDAASPVPQATLASWDCSSYAGKKHVYRLPTPGRRQLGRAGVCFAFLAVRFRGIDVLGTCKARVSFLKEVRF